MSTVPNFAGAFLSNAPPSCFNYAAIGSPFGIFVRPGGRVAAYVRSTGPQDGDDPFVTGNLVATISEGCKRCRSGQGDIVFVLPGHNETISTSSTLSLVAGAQIIGCGAVGATNAPTVTLTVDGGIAAQVADVTIAGLNIRGSSTTTAPVSSIGNGFTFVGNSIITTAVQSGAAILINTCSNVSIIGNYIAGNSNATSLISFIAACPNFVVAGNVGRQGSATITAGLVTVASNASTSGHILNNQFKTGATVTAGVGAVIIGAACIGTVGNHENYCCDETAAGGLVATGA